MGQGGNEVSPATRYAIAKQLENAGRDASDHGMGIGGGGVAGWHGWSPPVNEQSTPEDSNGEQHQGDRDPLIQVCVHLH